MYACCASISRDQLDELLTEVIVARLSSPDVFRQLRHASDSDDQTVVQARTEIDELNSQLETWRRAAIEGQPPRTPSPSSKQDSKPRSRKRGGGQTGSTSR
jgi:hypothetical protein